MSATARRMIVWRVFCPRCMTSFDGHAHEGAGDLVKRVSCTRCNKGFTVRTGVGGDGMPQCHTTPDAVRYPELVSDNQPFDLP